MFNAVQHRGTYAANQIHKFRERTGLRARDPWEESPLPRFIVEAFQGLACLRVEGVLLDSIPPRCEAGLGIPSSLWPGQIDVDCCESRWLSLT